MELLDEGLAPGMISLVRIHVPLTVCDSKRGVTAHVPNRVWEHILEKHSSWRSDDVKILYMTHRDMQEDTSLFIDAKDPDALADFLTKHIATMDHVRGLWVINMGKMRFFPIPQYRPRDFHRFTVTIDAAPKHLDSIYKCISSFKPGRDVMVNYIAHTFQTFNASIMVSVLARSRNHMDAFVQNCIHRLPGVLNTETTYISKTMRLVSPSEWEEIVGPFFVSPEGEPIEDIEVEDDSLIAGC